MYSKIYFLFKEHKAIHFYIHLVYIKIIFTFV